VYSTCAHERPNRGHARRCDGATGGGGATGRKPCVVHVRCELVRSDANSDEVGDAPRQKRPVTLSGFRQHEPQGDKPRGQAVARAELSVRTVRFSDLVSVSPARAGMGMGSTALAGALPV
jgi:hypothetical protein